MERPPKLLYHPGEMSAYYDDTRKVKLTTGGVFVFGSNLAGRHGKGAAKQALDEYGAIYGKGKGPQGRSYGLPTKDEGLRVLSLDEIQKHVSAFKWYAEMTTDSEYPYWFQLTAVGTGLAGYKDEDIAPMFKGVMNCWIPERWRPYIQPNKPKDVDAS